MAKKKIDVRSEGEGAGLKHSPFGALSQVAVAKSEGAGADAASAPAEPVKSEPAKPTAKPALALRREKKGRGGKTVVVVSGFGTGTEDARALLDELKRKLGSGGALEDGDKGVELVLQGDQPARVAELLRARGHRVSGVTS